MAAILVNSLSAVTATDCTKNLSRHFASAGGSTFIACNKTVARQHKPEYSIVLAHEPVTSTSLPGSIRPEFGRTQYLFFVSAVPTHV